MQPEKRVATRQGVPMEQIAEAQTRWNQIYVKMSRRVAGGKMFALGSRMMTCDELAKIEDYLKDLAGGGRFRIEPRNPDNILEYADPLPPFEVEIDGRPKPATPAEHGIQGVPGGIAAMEGPTTMVWNQPPQPPPPNQHYTPGPSPNVPDWVNRLPPSWGNSFAAQQRPQQVLNLMGEAPPPQTQQAPAAVYSSDYLGVQQLNYTREQLAKERAEREAERKQWEQRFEDLRKSIDEAKETAREARERAEREKLEAKLQAMQAVQQQKPSVDPQVWVGMIGALAPVLATMITSSRERDAKIAEQQAKAVELQMQGMNSVVQAATQKQSGGAGDLAVLLPALAPVLMKLIDNKGPAAQADLFSTLAENNLTTLTTMGQFLQSVIEMQAGDPWWRPLVESGIQSVQEVATQYAAMAGARQPPPAPQASGAAPIQAQPPQPRGMTQGMTIASAIVNNPAFPRELKTGAWAEVIAAMHDKMDATRVGQRIAEHIVDLDNAKELPKLFEGVFETPEPVLQRLLGVLPISKSAPDYVAQVMQIACGGLRNSTVEAEPTDVVDTQADEQDEQSDGQGEPETVPFNLNDFRQQKTREPVAVR